MEAQQVIEKILADAEAEAEKIKKQADKSIADEKAKLDEQLSDYKKQTEILARKAGEDEKLHLLAAARMNIAMEYLAEKRRILDEVFAQAQKQLQNLPDEEYRGLVTNLMLKLAETGDEEVIIDKNEKRIDSKLIDSVNEKLSSTNKAALKLSDKKQDIGAGFILKRGKIETNATLDALLAQARKELEIELAKELFEG